LDRISKVLDTQVADLSGNEQLRLGIATDATTVQNQIAEEGLRGLRSHDVFAIGRLDPQNPGHLELLVAHGFEQISSETISGSGPVAAALASPSAPPSHGTIALPNGLALVSAAPVTSHDQIFKGYLLIGELLVSKTLAPLATETRTSLMLSDGTHSLGSAGMSDVQTLLNGAVGKESKGGSVLTDDSGRLAGRALALAPPVNLWIGTSITGEAETLEQAAKLKVVLTWITSLGLTGALALVLMLRGARQSPPAIQVATTGAGITGASPSLSPSPTLPLVPTTSAGAPTASGVTPAGEPAPETTRPGVQPGNTPPGTDASLFGRYRLLDRLGSGGMAEVWTAVVYGVEGFRRPFVVKRIRRDMAANTDLVQQFIDEANLAGQLVHSNVVPVFDFGNLNGEYYLAQEYILGRDLGRITQALAERGRRLDPAIATYVLTEILKALDYAHTLTDQSGRPLGIVHRDVSPNNILCSMRGEVKLIDFGIAKSVSKVGQTEVGTVKGNLRFMSPEQAQGIPVDLRSDIFSLGMSLFFTQTGESLYTASSPYDLLLQAARGPQAADAPRVQELPPPLNELLMRALAPTAAQRYPSCQTFLETALPRAPADGARRLAALVMELFGQELRAQEQRFSDAIGAAATPPDTDATVQRLSPGVRQGLS
jgi:hypothetical protein